MKHLKTIFGAAVLIAAASSPGVAAKPSVPQYAAQGSDTARLRIALSKGSVPSTGAGDGMTAFLHSADDCRSPRVLGAVYTLDSAPAKHDPARRSHRKAGKLGMPLGEYDSLEVKELAVDAHPNQVIAVQFSVLLGGAFGAFTRCTLALEQDFEAGKDYEIVGRFDAPTSCSAVVNELVADPDGFVRSQIASFNSADNPLDSACFVKY
jgi:hypothetical protein